MTASPEVRTTEIRKSVIASVTAVLGQDGINPSTDLFDQGVTSLAFIRIVARLNEEYDIALDVTELEEASIDALADLVGAQVHHNDGDRSLSR